MSRGETEEKKRSTREKKSSSKKTKKESSRTKREKTSKKTRKEKKRESEKVVEQIDCHTFQPDEDKILEIRTSAAAELKKIFEQLSHLFGECNLIFLGNDPEDPDADALQINEINAEHDLFVKFNMPASNFSYYRCDTDRIVAGISTLEFHKKLKNIEDKDTIYMYILRSNKDFLHIICEKDKKKGDDDRVIDVQFMDLSRSELVIDEVKFESRISISSNKFMKIIKGMSASSDTLEISSGGKNVTFRVDSESGSVCSNHHHFKGDGVSCYHGRYNIKHVLVLAKLEKLCNKIDLYLLNNFPLVIVVEVSEIGRLVAFLLHKDNGTDFD